MKKPNITPGPWEIGPSYPFIRYSDPTTHYVLETGRMTLTQSPSLEDESKANAQAIAAVPDLLEALERALSIIEDLPYPQNYAAKDLRATLTKAGYTFPYPLAHWL